MKPSPRITIWVVQMMTLLHNLILNPSVQYAVLALGAAGIMLLCVLPSVLIHPTRSRREQTLDPKNRPWV